MQSRGRGGCGPRGRPRPSRPAPYTCPEIVGDASATTCAATSSGLRHLAECHRPRDAAHLLRVDDGRASSATRSSPVRRRSRGIAGFRRTTSFFSDSSRPPSDRRLRGGIVGVARLADQARRRAAEDRATPSRSPSCCEEAARGQERRGQVRVHGRAPPLERRAPTPGRRPAATIPAIAAQTSSSPTSANSRSTSASSVRSAPTTRDRSPPRRLGALAAPVVVDDRPPRRRRRKAARTLRRCRLSRR